MDGGASSGACCSGEMVILDVAKAAVSRMIRLQGSMVTGKK